MPHHYEAWAYSWYDYGSGPLAARSLLSWAIG